MQDHRAVAIGAALDSRKRLRSVSSDPQETPPRPRRENVMPIYKAPLEDVHFLLNDVFQIDRYDNLPGFSDASADVREAILNEAAKLSEQVLQPLNRTGDLAGCIRHDDGSVTTPKGFQEAVKKAQER